MKRYSKKLLCFILMLALGALSGCGQANNYDDTFASSGVSSLLPSDDNTELEWLVPPDTSTDESYLLGNGYTPSADNSTSHITENSGSSSSVSTPQQVLDNSSTTSGNSSTPPSSGEDIPTVTHPADFSMRGIWISCFEMPFDNKNEVGAAFAMDEMMRKVASLGYNTVFCHVRPAADAFYPSKYFPFSKYINWKQGMDPGYDPLKVMIASARKYGLKFHAWINPYRVSTSSTTSDLSSDNIALKWLSDSSERAVISGNGIYFNPGSTDVQQLILNGIREIVENYNVDGIHFDDYFYPTTDPSFDDVTYAKYKAATSRPLSLDDWRRSNVNALVSSAHKICKQAGILFGISPAGDISTDRTDRNYKTLYADVALWLSTEGYADYIIPQIYYGYQHPYKNSRYDRLLSIWKSLPKHSKMKLYIGLGAYKMDEECDDKAEWHNDNTLMARMALDAKKSGCDGIVVFSYSAAASDKVHNSQQIKNMFEAIK